MYEEIFIILGVALIVGAHVRRTKGRLLFSSLLAALPFIDYVTGRSYFGEYNAFVAFVSLSAALAMFYTAFAFEDAYPSATSLVIASTIGALVAAMGVNANRLRVLVGWELGSAPTYLLVAYERRYKPAKNYAAIGIIGSIIMLLGLVLYAASTKTLNFTVPADNLGTLGALLILTGMLVKLPVFPVHSRIIDVFDEGYPKSLPRIASGTKVVVFAALTVAIVNSLNIDKLLTFFAIVVAVTMTYANIAALSENDLFKIFAYSTIAHASYAAIGVIALTNQALVGTRIHILGTTAMKGGLLSLLIIAGIRNVDDLAGMTKNRRMAVAFVASIFSLIGIPPFIGFRSKYRLFMGSIGTKYRRLAVLLVINTVISIGYYGKLIAKAFEDGEPKYNDQRLLAVLILALLFLSLYPQGLFDFASKAIGAL